MFGAWFSVRRRWTPGPSELAKLARIRTAYTGEQLTEALAGLTVGQGLGLDSCSPAQARLRALLALGMFNGGPGLIDSPLGSANVAGLVTYTITVSPRHDNLILFSNAPDNIARRLVPNEVGNRGVPGMRVERTYRHDTAVLRHLPTDAILTVTRRRNLPPDVTSGHADTRCNEAFGNLTVERPLTDVERARLATIPPLGRTATRILAALTVRLNLRDADQQWAIGSFSWDPLHRADSTIDLHLGMGSRRLTGNTDRWRLTWGSYPYQADLEAALTHPLIGMAGLRRSATHGLVATRTASLQMAGPAHHDN